MRTLILFRHAKSDWEAEFANDHQRPLSQRGVRAARTMGQFLAASGQVPELALTSSARRAADTLDLARHQGAWNCPVQVKDALYEASVDDVLQLLRSFDETPRSLLLTGHEPTFSTLIAQLVGERCNVRFPTGAMARIDLPLESWSQLRPGSGELRWLVPPKLFKGDIRFS